jgi:flavin-dependent dehydrogenase
MQRFDVLVVGAGPGGSADKAKAIRDAAVFLRTEFRVPGMGDTMLRNVLHRLVFGRYKIPAAE